jgi:hypothetical protein
MLESLFSIYFLALLIDQGHFVINLIKFKIPLSFHIPVAQNLQLSCTRSVMKHRQYIRVSVGN